LLSVSITSLFGTAKQRMLRATVHENDGAAFWPNAIVYANSAVISGMSTEAK
jgi:hypothetical protein